MSLLGEWMQKHRVFALLIVVIFTVHVGSFTYLANLASANPDAAAYPIMKGDSETYAALAESLVAAGGFEGSAFETERHWPPGYPAFLALSKWFTGGFLFAVIAQTLLHLFAIYLIYLMTLKFLPPFWAGAPALLYGLDPSVVLANTTILSDGIFSSLIIMVVYLAFFTDVRQEWARWGTVAILLGAATLVRPIAQFLVLFAPLLLGTGLYLRGASARALVLPLTTFVAAGLLVLMPWLFFMHERHGIYEISHVGASNLLNYNTRDFLAWKEMNTEGDVPAILATRYRDNPAYQRVDTRITEALVARTPEGEDMANYQGAVATAFILDDPLSYAYFHAVNTAPFFLGSSIAAYQQIVVQIRDDAGYFAPTLLALVESARLLASGDLSALKPIAPIVLEMLFWAGACALALLGFWKERYDIAVLALAALVAYFAVLTGPVSIVRYRIPAEPYLLILAVLGAHLIYERMARRV